MFFIGIRIIDANGVVKQTECIELATREVFNSKNIICLVYLVNLFESKLLCLESELGEH